MRGLPDSQFLLPFANSPMPDRTLSPRERCYDPSMDLCQRADEVGRLLRHAIAVAVLGGVLAGCASGRMGPPPDTKAPDGPHTLKKLSVAERQQVMERANVWRPLNISSLDIVRGPALPASQRIPAQVACTFVYPDKPLGGMTPKFLCDLGKGDVVKVKDRGEERRSLRGGGGQSTALGAGVSVGCDVPHSRHVPQLPGRSVCRERRRLAARQTDRCLDEAVRSGGGRA